MAKNFLDKARAKKRADEGQPSPSAGIADVMRQESEDSRLDKSVRFLPLDAIRIEKQIRAVDYDMVDDYARTIRESKTKQPINPITVYQDPDGHYILETGEHRLRAQMLNRDEHAGGDANAYQTIRATVNDTKRTPLERKQEQVRENLLRNELNPVELAVVVREFLDENPDATLAQAAAWAGFSSDKISTGRSTISRALKLLDSEQTDIIEAVASGDMPMSKAIKEVDRRDKDGAESTEQSNDNDDFGDVGSIDDGFSGAEGEGGGEPSNEPAAKKSASEDKPSLPKRFSIEYPDAVALMSLLRQAALDADLDFPEVDTLNRKVFDTAIREILPLLINE